MAVSSFCPRHLGPVRAVLHDLQRGHRGHQRLLPRQLELRLPEALVQPVAARRPGLVVQPRQLAVQLAGRPGGHGDRLHRDALLVRTAAGDRVAMEIDYIEMRYLQGQQRPMKPF